MLKKVSAFILAFAIMLVPILGSAEYTDKISFKDEQVSIEIPQGISYREDVIDDYTGSTEEALRMSQILLVFAKNEMYMKLDYIADEGGKTYDMSDEKSALKMFEERGELIMRDDIVSSNTAETADMSDPEYFVADNGVGYIKVSHKADGSDKVNIVTYLTCSEDTVYKMFVLFGNLDKKKERYNALSEENISTAEKMIGSYQDKGYDEAFLAGETGTEKGSTLKGAVKFGAIGLVIGFVFLGIYFLANQLRKRKKGEVNMFDEDKRMDSIKVQSVKDSYAHKGKNPNAKKGKK